MIDRHSGHLARDGRPWLPPAALQHRDELLPLGSVEEPDTHLARFAGRGKGELVEGAAAKLLGR
jgi:hypothetical protein